MIEFEIKARVPSTRLDAVRRALGAPTRVEEHADVYYQHPCRDFAVTDEAIRVSRRAGVSDVTYKGPKLDATTKARREIVLPVGDEAAARALLEALGFTEVMVVPKRREVHRHGLFTVALDEVGKLGWFVELERMLPTDAPRDEVEAQARELLRAWGITRTERRSYLELMRSKSR